MSWFVKCQSFLFFSPFLFLMLRLLWLMLHLWWVLFWFCFVLQIVVRRGEYWVFSLFSFLSHSSYFINHRSVTQSKKSDYTVYFFHWYLFIGHLYVLCVLLFCGGQTGLKVEELVCHWHFTIVYRKQNIVFSHHTTVQSIKKRINRLK